jgi:hypothetical protein
MQNNLRCNYLIQYHFWQKNLEEFMQQNEEGQHWGLKKHELFEDYFSSNPSKIKEMPSLSSVEKFLQSFSCDEDMQSSILDKYLLTLYAESTFSSPEPFTPKSDSSSQSDTTTPNITEASEMIVIPPIQIPKTNTTGVILEKLSVKSNSSSSSFFDWSPEQSLLDSSPIIEKKTLKNSEFDILSGVLGMCHKVALKQIIILAGMNCISESALSQKKNSLAEIISRKL